MERSFERSHPWLKFQVDLQRNDPALWLNLGEASSKCEHLAGVPLQPAIALRLHEIYLAKGVAATTAIEGNTLTEDQVLQHLHGELTLPPSQDYLAQEVDNVVRACHEIAGHLVGPLQNPKICVDLLCSYNQQVRAGLAEKADISPPGKIRHESVLVGSVYRGAPAEDCEWLLEHFCEWINGQGFVAPTERYRIPFAIIKAVIAHLYMAWIHPFGDGNGRTARLLEFHLLLEAGVPLPAAHLLSDHYNRTRHEYYRQLDRASKSGGAVLPFICYAVQGFVDGLKTQLAEVREQQWRVSWENYVHEIFGSAKASETSKRHRDVALELGKLPGWKEVGELAMLTPKLAQAYAKKTRRTIERDLIAIELSGLIERQHGRVRARRELILAFLPARSQTAEHSDKPQK